MSTNASPATMPTFHDETQRPEEFTLQTRAHVEWALGKIAALDAEERLIEAQAKKALARIRADRERFTGRYLPQVESWTRGELERTKSRKRSIVFLHGTVQFTSSAARLTVESLPDALTTARAVAPQTVTEETPAPVVKLDKKAFLAYATAHFEETGEILPGVKRTEASDRLSLKFAEEEDTEEGGEQETP
jgi:hypothetical protein